MEQKLITRRPNGTIKVQTINNQPSRTQQQFKDQCDVNKIIAKFKRTGSVTHLKNVQEGVYADLSQLPSLQEAENAVIAAQQAFEAVPALTRQRFGNDPKLFVDFLSDPKNDEEAIKMGLKVKVKTPDPDPVLNELKSLNQNLTKKAQKSE